MPRTLVVTNDFPPKSGGIENFVFQLVRRLPPKEVVVFTSSAEGDATFDADLPFPVVRARTRVLLPTPHIQRGAELLVEHFNCDSVWFGAAASLGLMTADLRRRGRARRFVGSTHSHECFWTKAPPTRAAIRSLGQNLDHLTYISTYAKTVIGGALTPAARCRLVPLSPGADIAQFWPRADPSAVVRELGLAGRRVIVSASRLVPHKGQDTLIRALPLVLKAVPDAALLVVGGGSYRADLERLAAKLSVGDAVRFAGLVPNDQIAPYYAAGQVFALPTRDRTLGLQVEGLPLVALEAAAAGLPLVIGNSGGAPETVKDGQTGFVVDSTDVHDVARRLIELLANPSLACAMGEAGHSWVASDWTWDQRAATLRSLLQPG
ncbi:MAG: glycosyltransferase family 4 protein [Bifidobacteriaceae bacterium]|jgi:phosphatidylinositol alpha-1,6-mannosyltransferase|nr:glycosyltransferase family 4 protein [Bifidobacteriaceae bacterium]